MPAAGRLRWLTAVLAACILAGLPATSAPAAAHPLGNFTVNRYSRVEIGSGRLRVRYVLDLAEIPSVQEAQVADLNHDGVVSTTEWDAYRDRRVEELRTNLLLTIDGTPVPLQTDSASLTTPPGQANVPLIRIEAWFDAPAAWQASPNSLHAATFEDRNEPARLGWREIVVQASPGVLVSHSTVPATDTTDELRAYPDRFLQDPLNARQASWTFETSGANGSTAPPASLASPSGNGGRPVDPFTSLVTAKDLNVSVVLVALAAAATLGGIHAASPGHGKAMMAAYIVGTRGTWIHAVALGMSVTVSHTFGVLVLGAITLVASNLILPEQLYPWLTLVAALIVLGFGGVLLVGALRGLRREQPAHAHSHDHHDHDHHNQHGASHEHEHVHEPQRALPITWRNLFVLGLAGGLVPSASALVVLLSALALGRLGFGLLLIVAFGSGMAVVLTTTGVLLVYASRFVTRYFPDHAQSPLQRVFARGVPVASAAIMLLIGVIATLQALGQFGIVPL